MVYINRNRRHDEDLQYRREKKGSADSLESRRGEFIRFMKTKGYSRDQIDRELKLFDQVVERRRDDGDQNQVDPDADSLRVL